MSGDTRNAIIYILGIAALVGILFVIILKVNDSGFGFINTNPDKTYSAPPAFTIDKNKNYQAIIHTNLGDIKYQLLAANAPITVNNFVFLAKDHYYDGVKFHRVVKDFIIQSGSRLSLGNNPQNYGLGGPGYTFQDEINWDSLHLDQNTIKNLQSQGFKNDTAVSSVPFAKYSLAMANAGPDTNGSQFFIATGDPASDSIKALNGKHTVFGTIISGQDVADKINSTEVNDPTSTSPIPKSDIIIKTIDIIVS